MRVLLDGFIEAMRAVLMRIDAHPAIGNR